jgi:hypothetical protein
MTTYDNTNRGAIFVNEKQRPGKDDPDRSGSINIEGVDYWINGWLKEKDGKKYMSLAVKRKEGGSSSGASTSGGSQKKADF